MTRKTWLINDGYKVDCSCISGSTSGSSGSVDLSNIENSLNQINNTLNVIALEVEDIQAPTTEVNILTSGSSVIPAGVYSYSIINLGEDPDDPNSVVHPMIINGLSINNKIVKYGNDGGGIRPLANAVPYDANGNTLNVIYNN